MKNYIGRYARSIETGWLGVIVAVETHNGETFFKMKGVNELCLTVAGGKAADYIDEDDTRWFVPADVRFVGNYKISPSLVERLG